MSKRLQITITDEGYKKLLAIAEACHISKSAVLEMVIHDLYKRLDKENIFE